MSSVLSSRLVRTARSTRTLAAAALVALASLAASRTASANTTHVVGRGHTLQAIANRYHVSVKAIEEANPSIDPRHLKIGDTLTIPGVAASGLNAKRVHASGKNGALGDKSGHDERHPAKKPTTYAMRSPHPHVVHATRLNNGDAVTLTTADRRGRVPGPSLKTMENLMRSSGNLAHPPDPRLVSLLGIVSDHFGGRKIEVISGFRPYTSTQHTPHSNHNVGKAIDFRVVGVPNEVLRDFCRTLKNTGCGYYPNSTFVHMDARSSQAFWIDYSRPGEAPRYDAPNADADDSTSDVAEETDASSMAKAPANADSADSDDAPSAAAPAANPGPSAPPAAPGAGSGASAAAKPMVPGAAVPPATQ
jgi:uncharacterized protein YcbK (DUF882 family)